LFTSQVLGQHISGSQSSLPLSFTQSLIESINMLDSIAIISLLYTAITVLLSYWVAHGRIAPRSTSRTDRLVLAWLIWDIIIHVTFEGPFVILSLIGTIKESSSFTALVWKEYGKADSRWLVSDPTIVSLEILTVFVVAPLCLLLVYAICKRRPYRHWVQLVVCTCELYGGWMTFGPEFLTGSPSLTYNNPFYLYVYLIFFNGLWVVIPALLMYQSWHDMSHHKSDVIKHSPAASRVTAKNK
jgi:hypothetical protein